jgi:peptidyl-prolyl cis-trans isomerase C
LFSCTQGDEDNSPVLATVGKEKITENEFIKEANRIPEWARDQFITEEGKKRLLDELVKKDLLYQYARKMRLHKDKEYIERVKEFEKMALVALLLKKEIDDMVSVSDEEIREFYEKNKDKITKGTQFRASHILVATEEEANSIYDRIMKGESFATLAKEYSLDKVSAEKGGDLGYFGSGRMVPEFERALIGMKKGEISKPVRTRFGYHIIKLTDIKKGKPATFEDAKESIRRQLILQKRKQRFDEFIARLKSETDITINEDLLSQVKLPWEKELETTGTTTEEKKP